MFTTSKMVKIGENSTPYLAIPTGITKSGYAITQLTKLRKHPGWIVGDGGIQEWRFVSFIHGDGEIYLYGPYFQGISLHEILCGDIRRALYFLEKLVHALTQLRVKGLPNFTLQTNAIFFQEGRLTDGQGRIIDFRNTLIIMTSNLGSEFIQQAKDIADVKDQINALLKATFKPEFLNRIDEIITFNRLGKEEILKIVDIQLRKLEERLSEIKLTLEVSQSAREFLVEIGYEPLFGARPLKRTIENNIQNVLAKRILAGDYKENAIITVDKNETQLVFSTNERIASPVP